MADVSQQFPLPAECYRGGSSPRSASTPGPSAPDSPANSASSSGRFSTSPSAVLGYPPSQHLHHHPYSPYYPAAAMGLMGSFLSVAPYGPYAALAAAAMAGQLAPPPPFINRLRAPQLSPPQHVSRVLPFSVENILKPDFGRTVPQEQSSPSSSSSPVTEPSAQQPLEVKPTIREAIKRPATTAITSLGSPNGAKKVKITTSPPAVSRTSRPNMPVAPTVTIKPDPADGRTSSCTDTSDAGSSSGKDNGEHSNGPTELPTDPAKMTDPSKWPAWIFCTRYSDRPSSGPRSRRTKKDRKVEEKRPRTAFTSEQLARLKNEFNENRYLNEKRRQDLANELQLNENQIKIWFQNKRAKIKKTSGQKNPLALQLMAQGLYNHTTVTEDDDEDGFNQQEQHSD